MQPSVEYFALHPKQFRELELTEQLSLIADIALYWAEKKIDALEAEGKTRVDSCIPAQKAQAKEKYWESLNQNLKKIAELKTAELRRGIL